MHTTLRAPWAAERFHIVCRWFAFGCSHGREVVCVDGHTGAEVWRTLVTGRADIGMALTADLKVSASFFSSTCTCPFNFCQS